MIFYFSGTGNSAGIAKMLAERIGDEAVNLIHANPEKYQFQSTDYLGFVFPVYAYAAPQVVIEFAGKITPNGAYTFAVPTFSNVAGMTLEHFSKILPLDGGFGIKMPDNMPVFDKIVETEETVKKKLSDAAVRFEKVAEKVKSKEKGFDILRGEDAEKNTFVLSPRYHETMLVTKPYHITEEKCTGCGLCEKLCPAKAIKIKEGKPCWVKENCYLCMACFNLCPTEAVEYGPYSEGKFRYHFKGFDIDKYFT